MLTVTLTVCWLYVDCYVSRCVCSQLPEPLNVNTSKWGRVPFTNSTPSHQATSRAFWRIVRYVSRCVCSQPKRFLACEHVDGDARPSAILPILSKPSAVHCGELFGYSDIDGGLVAFCHLCDCGDWHAANFLQSLDDACFALSQGLTAVHVLGHVLYERVNAIHY